MKLKEVLYTVFVCNSEQSEKDNLTFKENSFLKVTKRVKTLRSQIMSLTVFHQ